MGKKLGVFRIILLLTVAVYGCIIFKNNTKEVNNPREINAVSESKDNANFPFGVKIDNNTTDITSAVNNKDMNIRFLQSIDKDKLLIASDMSVSSDERKKVNIKIFNLLNGKTEKQVDITLENPYYNFMPLNKGFCISDENIAKSDARALYHIYDNELNFIRTVDFSDVKNKLYGKPILSNNADKFAYIDSSDGKGASIYICDLDFKNKHKVYEVEYCTPNKLSDFINITFVSSDKKISFTGSIYINEDTSPLAFGTVSIDGEDFNYKEHDGINSSIQISKGKTFFSDANTERGKDSSGQVFLKDNDSNNVEEYLLKDKNESQRAYISDIGNFIVTIQGGKSKENEPIYRLRIYDTKTKNIIKQIDTTLKGKDYLRCHISSICISEANNSIFIAYKLDKEVKLYQYKLN